MVAPPTKMSTQESGSQCDRENPRIDAPSTVMINTKAVAPAGASTGPSRPHHEPAAHRASAPELTSSRVYVS